MTLPSSLKSKFYIDGHFSPIKIFSQEETAQLFKDYEKYLGKLGTEGDARYRVHLVTKWAQGIVTHPVLVSAVKTVLGSNNVLCLQSELCSEPPAGGGDSSWRQEAANSGLEPSDRVVTAWLALTESSSGSGCLSVISGSQEEQLPHQTGQGGDKPVIAESELAHFPAESRVRMELEAGQVSIHSWRSAVLSPGPNRSKEDRVGLAITYCTDEVQNMKAVVVRERASLICGSGGMFWDLETPPTKDYGAKELEQQRLSCERARSNLQSGSEREQENGEEEE